MVLHACKEEITAPNGTDNWQKEERMENIGESVTPKKGDVTHSDKELLRRRVEDAGREFLLRLHRDADLLRRGGDKREHRRVVLRKQEAGATLLRERRRRPLTGGVLLRFLHPLLRRRRTRCFSGLAAPRRSLSYPRPISYKWINPVNQVMV